MYESKIINYVNVATCILDLIFIILYSVLLNKIEKDSHDYSLLFKDLIIIVGVFVVQFILSILYYKQKISRTLCIFITFILSSIILGTMSHTWAKLETKNKTTLSGIIIYILSLLFYIGLDAYFISKPKSELKSEPEPNFEPIPSRPIPSRPRHTSEPIPSKFKPSPRNTSAPELTRDPIPLTKEKHIVRKRLEEELDRLLKEVNNDKKALDITQINEDKKALDITQIIEGKKAFIIFINYILSLPDKELNGLKDKTNGQIYYDFVVGKIV